MTDGSTSEPEKPRGDPLKFGIVLIAVGVAVAIFAGVVALAARQPIYLLVTLFSLYNFYSGAKYIRIGLKARQDAATETGRHPEG